MRNKFYLAAMNVYLTLYQVPELRELPREVRRVVVYRALEILRSRSRLFYWLPNLFCAVGGIVGPFLGASLLGLHPGPGMSGNIAAESIWCSLSSVLVGGFIAGYIGLQLQYWKLRPLLPRVIADYISEVLRPS